MKFIDRYDEIRADSEKEAQEIINQYKEEAITQGYIINTAYYIYKTRRLEGGIIEEAWLCKILLTFNDFWDEESSQN